MKTPRSKQRRHIKAKTETPTTHNEYTQNLKMKKLKTKNEYT